LDKEHAPSLWREFENLKTEAESASRQYLNFSFNIELLGFLSGVMEKIEDYQAIEQLQKEINSNSQILVEQAI